MTVIREGKLSLRPLGLLGPAECEATEEPLRGLAGGALSFSHCEAVLAHRTEMPGAPCLPLAAIAPWAEQQAAGQEIAGRRGDLLERLARPRPVRSVAL